ncbi:MAG: hypothetical protein ACKODX_03555 [Gemmata sp.]
MTDTRETGLGRAAKRALAALLAMVLGAVGGARLAPPRPVEVERRAEPARPAPAGPGFDPPPTGWVRDEDVIAANLDPVETLHFDTTPAGRAARGDEDVFLYRLVRKVNGRAAPWYPNIDQGDVGCCVGAGAKHGCDVVQATAIAAGAGFEWKPASAEVIYAGSRIDVGGGQLRGDGSVGAWARRYLKEKGGIAPMEQIGAHDLTAFSPARARQWGRTGVPPEVQAVARAHPVKGAALVTRAADVKRAVAQGYPVVVCSDVGFNDRDGSVGTRDAHGFIAPRGTWPHCMLLLGWRGGPRPGALCLNSWGDRAHGGPVWPADMPVAAFWIDEAVVDRMVRQGDSFALADVAGFPARDPDWFIRAGPDRARPRGRTPDVLSLRP